MSQTTEYDVMQHKRLEATAAEQAAIGEDVPHSANGERYFHESEPRRLSPRTRALAAMALRGDHGQEMVRARESIPWDANAMETLSPDLRYGQAILTCARHAPLRLLDGEYLAGSATLLEACEHQTPLLDVRSTSHTTLGFDKVLSTGFKGLRERVAERLLRGDLDEGPRDFLISMQQCLEAAEIWRRRYLELIDQRIESASGETQARYREMRYNLERVPEKPARNFREAVQSLWFMYAFQRLMGTWSGLGRIDAMLRPYLEADLASSVITLDEAREYIAHFWIKGCEWIGCRDHRPSGGSQFFQNVLLAGVDENGDETANTVSYLVLDVVEELHISDYPITVRLNRHSPDRLLRHMAHVQRYGGGIVAAYNEEVVIQGLVDFGYTLREARTFTNDGCWEVLIPGKTSFMYRPFDALGFLHTVLGLTTPDEPAPDFVNFDALFDAYARRLQGHIDAFMLDADTCWSNPDLPCPLVSLFVEDCIEKATSYHAGGAHYRVLAPHAGRLVNVANSLTVIKRLVFDEERLSLPEFVGILRDNWTGHDNLRALVKKHFSFYGNDSDESDAMMQRVFNTYTGMVAEVRERNGTLRPCGISTFGREIEWAVQPDKNRATAEGNREGAVLATNFSPSPGTDLNGPTAVLNSYCKMDFTRTPNGATIELKVHPLSVMGENGLLAIESLMRTMVHQGGFFMQIDVVDSEMLRDAQKYPEKYPNLSVRISGWSARFATLDRHWQDMVIQRTQQSF